MNGKTHQVMMILVLGHPAPAGNAYTAATFRPCTTWRTFEIAGAPIPQFTTLGDEVIPPKF